jgi:hypothetical protein
MSAQAASAEKGMAMHQPGGAPQGPPAQRYMKPPVMVPQNPTAQDGFSIGFQNKHGGFQFQRQYQYYYPWGYYYPYNRTYRSSPVQNPSLPSEPLSYQREDTKVAQPDPPRAPVQPKLMRVTPKGQVIIESPQPDKGKGTAKSN